MTKTLSSLVPLFVCDSFSYILLVHLVYCTDSYILRRIKNVVVRNTTQHTEKA